jgi:hypothetical protein
MIHKAFVRYEGQILLAVFGRHCNEATRSRLHELFWELVFAIRHEFVGRDIAEKLFALGWKVFRQRDAEELLLPVGRALAWSFCLDNRDEHGIELLEKLVHGDAPFDHRFRGMKFSDRMYRNDFRRMWPKITLLPIFRLLSNLRGERGILPAGQDQLGAIIAGSEEDIFLAEVGEHGIGIYWLLESITC